MCGPNNSQPGEGDFITPQDLHLFNEGTHLRLFEKLGAHCLSRSGVSGVHFAVWAPNAAHVSLIGEFNDWNKTSHPLSPTGVSGIWTTFVSELRPGERYKYHIVSREQSYQVDKADPFGFHQEVPPLTGSVVWDLSFEWGDGAWMSRRDGSLGLNSPVSIYEVHLGSWIRSPEHPHDWLNCREIAPKLAEYVGQLGFTHVEFLPVMEHPFYGSWGYQSTGYFAPTSRYGSPQDFMFLVDYLHQRGIGVVLDWVPSHFPSDEHGLAYFDGTHLFEHGDPRQGLHPDWNSYLFNYGRPEVRSFLLSGAIFWLDQYHADGLRVDAVASMLYRDYSRKPGAWVPNQFGGRENLEAIEFLRQLNLNVYQHFSDVQMVAEESTAWPMVSRPTYVGGLGFGYKWDMGFMHDTLNYFSQDPLFRKYRHNDLTFRGMYAFNENFVLPFSHDEVVHGQGSLLSRLPGDNWQKFANLRLLLGYLFLQPGKKLLFMGDEFGQRREWNHELSLDWHLLDDRFHSGVKNWVGDLNRAYRQYAGLHQADSDSAGFEWIDCHDTEQSTLSWLRQDSSKQDRFLAICNFTPIVRRNYRLGVPAGGRWRELLNSDAAYYGGSGQGNLGDVTSAPFPSHGRPHTLTITLPPLALICFRWEGGAA